MHNKKILRERKEIWRENKKMQVRENSAREQRLRMIGAAYSVG